MLSHLEKLIEDCEGLLSIGRELTADERRQLQNVRWDIEDEQARIYRSQRIKALALHCADMLKSLESGTYLENDDGCRAADFD